jgi:hypothetical protein
MLLKILGILDIFIGICLWIFGIFNLIPANFILILGLFLLAKGLIFITGFSIISFLDIVIAGAIIIATSVQLPKLIIIILSLFLLQKGILSLLS